MTSTDGLRDRPHPFTVAPTPRFWSDVRQTDLFQNDLVSVWVNKCVTDIDENLCYRLKFRSLSTVDQEISTSNGQGIESYVLKRTGPTMVENDGPETRVADVGVHRIYLSRSGE